MYVGFPASTATILAKARVKVTRGKTRDWYLPWLLGLPAKSQRYSLRIRFFYWRRPAGAHTGIFGAAACRHRGRSRCQGREASRRTPPEQSAGAVRRDGTPFSSEGA